MPPLKPASDESEQDFLGRFMTDTSMESEFPDKGKRAEMAASTYRENAGNFCAICTTKFDAWKDYDSHMKKEHSPTPAGVKNQRGQVGIRMPMRFILPGLVRYADVGDVLVNKESLDRILPTFDGRPIFEGHQDVTESDFTDGKPVGIVSGNLQFNALDGWYWGDILVWEEGTLEKIKNAGWTLSCAYDVTEWGPGGVHNNIPYDREVLNGEYTHLAIVPNPRYEGVRIIYNQGGHMKMKFWPFAKDVKPEDQKASEVELTNAKIEVNGKEVPLTDIVSRYEAEQSKIETDALLNNLKDDDEIEIRGKKVKVSTLRAFASKALKNEDDDEEKKKKAKDDEERKNAEEKAKKEEDEKENQKNDDEHEKGEHKEKEMDNCLSCKAEKSRKNAQHFEDLRNAHVNRDGEFKVPELKSLDDRVAEGQKRYGPKN